MNPKTTYFEAVCENIKQTSRGSITLAPITEIDINIPYGGDSVFSRMSGGTTLKLMTINKDSADLFKVDRKYRVTIEPIED